MSEIGTPTALAAFPSASSSSSKAHIKLGRVHGSEETQAVAAVQGGAVWIYDVTSHQAITSFTVPPSTVFHTSPVSYHPAVSGSTESGSTSRKGKQRQRYTAVAIAKGENVSPENEKKTIWLWKGEEVFEQSTIQLEHEVEILVRIPEAHSLLAGSHQGLTVITPDLTRITIPFQLPSSSTKLIKIFFLPRIPHSEINPYGLMFDDGKVVFVAVSGLNEKNCVVEDPKRAVKGLEKGTLENGEKVVDAFMDDKTSSVHILTSNGRMIPNAMSFRTDSSLKPSSSFTFSSISSTSIPQIASLPESAGPLFVHATPTSSLIVFQPTYPAVLAHREIQTKNLGIKEIVPLTNAIVAVISTTTNEAGAERWMVHTVDINAPVDGVGIAQLLGSAESTNQFLIPSTSVLQTRASVSKDTVFDAITERDETFLNTLRSALFSASNRDAAAALKVWHKWNLENEQPFTRKKVDAGRRMRSRGLLAGEIVGVVFEGALPRSRKNENKISREEEEGEKEGQSWITTGAKGAYLKEVVRILIEFGWVNDGMWGKGGVILDGLLVIGDWDNITLALRKMTSIPSTTLVALVAHAVAYHSDPNASVETGLAPPPALDVLLKAYLAVPVSPAMHKQALKQGLRQVEHVQKVLEVMVGWLEDVGKEGLGQGLKWDENVEEDADRFPVEGLVLHTQLILDAHLPLLISHTPAHPLIQRLKTALAPLLIAETELVAARGLVEGFARLAGQKAGSGRGKRGKGVKGVHSGGKRMFGEFMDPLYSVDEVVL